MPHRIQSLSIGEVTATQFTFFRRTLELRGWTCPPWPSVAVRVLVPGAGAGRLMAFNFPNDPAVGQDFTPAGGPTYTWDGLAWRTTTEAGGTFRVIACRHPADRRGHEFALVVHPRWHARHQL